MANPQGQWFEALPSGQNKAFPPPAVENFSLKIDSTAASASTPAPAADQSPFGAIGSGIASSLAASLYNTTRQQTSTVLGGLLDTQRFKPFFDVEPVTVLKRMLLALLPRNAASVEGVDLYSPVVLSFTLMLLLHYVYNFQPGAGSKNTDLMAASVAFVFSFWVVSALLFRGLVYFFDSSLTTIQVISFTGYALIGCCVDVVIILFLYALNQHAPLTLLIIPLLLDSASLGTVFFHSTPASSKRALVSVLAFFANLLMQYYLIAGARIALARAEQAPTPSHSQQHLNSSMDN